MCGEKMTLQNIKGVGDKISEKIINSVGGEDELQKIVDNVDVEKIANIEGISQRKAIEIMNQLLNNPEYEFIKSDRAMELYDDIINKILAYSTLPIQKTEYFCFHHQKILIR
jgi:Holliday junction resolvasome RuvABC DNA-binding subunit